MYDTSPFLESEPSTYLRGHDMRGKTENHKLHCDVSKYINYMPTTRPATVSAASADPPPVCVPAAGLKNVRTR